MLLHVIEQLLRGTDLACHYLAKLLAIPMTRFSTINSETMAHLLICFVSKDLIDVVDGLHDCFLHFWRNFILSFPYLIFRSDLPFGTPSERSTSH